MEFLGIAGGCWGACSEVVGRVEDCSLSSCWWHFVLGFFFCRVRM